MAEIIKVFKEHIPAMRFIGKRYDDIGHWGEWFANGWFDQLENAMGGVDKILSIWENGGAYVGLERRKEAEPFEYWIGMFTPADTAAPDGFCCIDFGEGNLGTCWIYGKEDAVHDTRRCKEALRNEGIEIIPMIDGAVYSFENCLCPRFTTPDETGNIILDYCYFVK